MNIRLSFILSLFFASFYSILAQTPTLTCPTDTTLYNSSTCNVTLNYPISCNSNCAGSSTYQSDITGYSSGDSFPLGTTLQEHTITNGTDSSTCSFNVIIVDTISPNINCLGTQNVSANLNCQAILGDYSSVISSLDNCDIPLITQSPIAGATITGSELITMYATDNSGNIDSCSFLIIVDDNIPPTISCPTDSNVYIDTNCMYTLDDLSGYITVFDNCDPNVTITQSPLVGTLFNIGDDPFISFNVTDITGNTSVCSYRISVIDSTAPVINCPSNQSGFLNSNCENILPDFTNLVSSTDNCSGSVFILQSPTAGTLITGTANNTITFTSTDSYSNSNSCSIIYTAIDTISPIILSCINDTTRFPDSNCIYFLEDFTSLLQIEDNCQTSYIFSQSPPIGTPLGIGASTLTTITVADSSNNNVSCSFLIDVQDNKPPLLICPSNPNAVLDSNCLYIIPNFEDIINLVDNCDPNPSYSQSINTGDTLIGIGTQQTIILNSSDMYGNATSCSFTITLTDTISPIIICPDSQFIDLDLNCLYTVPDITLLTTASDFCDLNPQISQSIPTGTSTGGIITINIVAIDNSGNSSTCPVILMPNDTINPTIICPESIASCNPTVSFISPSASDDCGTINLYQTDSTNLNSGSQFPTGITTLNFLAQDLVGNQSTCNVQIEIFEAPSIEAGNDLFIAEGNSITIDATATNASFIQWLPLYNIVDANNEDPTISPLNSTTYFVTVESDDGCIASDSIIVFVTQITDIVINNIITPNGDGKNDTWDINKPSFISGCPVSIFNRWGKVVWESTNYYNNWKGENFNGELLPDGTYYYTIICQGDEYKGSILLIK
jgi:gliding motility-associated-like protein